MYFPQYINPTWFPSLFNHEQNNDFTGRIILPYYVYGPSYAYEYQYEYGNYDDKGSSLFLILFFFNFDLDNPLEHSFYSMDDEDLLNLLLVDYYDGILDDLFSVKSNNRTKLKKKKDQKMFSSAFDPSTFGIFPDIQDDEMCGGIPDVDGNGWTDSGADSCQGDSGGPLICNDQGDFMSFTCPSIR